MRRILAGLTLLFAITANSSTPAACEHLAEGRLYIERASPGNAQQYSELTSSNQCTSNGPIKLVFKLPRSFTQSVGDCIRAAGRLAVIIKRPETELKDALNEDEEDAILNASEPGRQIKRLRIILQKHNTSETTTVSVADYQAFHMQSSGGARNLMYDLRRWHGASYTPCRPIETDQSIIGWIKRQISALGFGATLSTYSDCNVRARVSLIGDMKSCQTDADVDARRDAVFGRRNDCDRYKRLAAACQLRPRKDNSVLAHVQIIPYQVTDGGHICVALTIPSDMCAMGNSIALVELYPGTTVDYLKSITLK